MVLIAIDGPSGSGKSTLAAALAIRLGTARLDTGAMYRAVGYAALERGCDLDDEAALAALAKELSIEVAERVVVDGVDVSAAIRADEVSKAASAVATKPAVRAEMVRRQQEWIAQHGGGIVEGRDIGTVVAPHADLKIFLTADLDERGRRRSAQAFGDAAPEVVRAEMAARDHADSSRPASPLAIADDAVVLDSTAKTVDEIVHEVLADLSARASSAPARPAQVSAPPTRVSAATSEATPPRRSLVDLVVYQFCRFVSVGFSRLYLPGPVRHRRRLPRSGPYIVAPVHRSYVDWLVVARITKRRLRYLVKGEVWKVRAVGRFLEILGAFPVHRGAADREAMSRALEALSGGEPLVMFPEGTRYSGEEIGEIKEGAAYVALRAGVPIVPIGIGGTERSMARGRKIPRPVWTRVVIGEPLYFSAGNAGKASARVPRSAVRAASEQLRQALQDVFDESERRPRRG